MKGFDIFKAMSETKEEHIIQSEEFVKPKKLSGKALVVALAVLILAPVTVASAAVIVHMQLKNRESAEIYFDNTDLLEEYGAVENQVMENEHVRITLDAVVSDGHFALAVVTLDALDEQGRNYIDYKPNFALRRMDTGEITYPTGGAAITNREAQTSKDTVRYCHIIDLLGMETSCEYEMIFYSMDIFTEEDRMAGVTKQLDEEGIPEGNSLGHDFVAQVSFANNADSAMLTSADGKEIKLTQFQVVDEGGEVLSGKSNSVSLIKLDGSLEKLGKSGMLIRVSENKKTHSAMFLGKMIDLKGYKGVEIDGVKYLK